MKNGSRCFVDYLLLPFHDQSVSSKVEIDPGDRSFVVVLGKPGSCRYTIEMSLSKGKKGSLYRKKKKKIIHPVLPPILYFERTLY